jgi:hypothetical protein
MVVAGLFISLVLLPAMGWTLDDEQYWAAYWHGAYIEIDGPGTVVSGSTVPYDIYLLDGETGDLLAQDEVEYTFTVVAPATVTITAELEGYSGSKVVEVVESQAQADAEAAIFDAQEAFEQAQDVIDGNVAPEAECWDMLNMAEQMLTDAQDSYNSGEFEEAINLANASRQVSDQARMNAEDLLIAAGEAIDSCESACSDINNTESEYFPVISDAEDQVNTPLPASLDPPPPACQTQWNAVEETLDIWHMVTEQMMRVLGTAVTGLDALLSVREEMESAIIELACPSLAIVNDAISYVQTAYVLCDEVASVGDELRNFSSEWDAVSQDYDAKLAAYNACMMAQ